jgi:O-antigen/teichoic acid export membrane protein
MPLVAVLYYGAEDVLGLIADGRWVAGAPAVQVLVWGALLRGAAQMFPQVYAASGRANYALIDSFVSMILLVGCFWLGLRFFPEAGMLSVCWAWFVAYPGILCMHMYLTRKITPLGVLEYLQTMLPALGGALCMLIAMAAVALLGLRSHGHLLALAGWIVAGLAAYFAYLRVALGIGLKELLPRKEPPATA